MLESCRNSLNLIDLYKHKTSMETVSRFKNGNKYNKNLLLQNGKLSMHKQ